LYFEKVNVVFCFPRNSGCLNNSSAKKLDKKSVDSLGSGLHMTAPSTSSLQPPPGELPDPILTYCLRTDFMTFKNIRRKNRRLYGNLLG
jgi:hypothetical protein